MVKLWTTTELRQFAERLTRDGCETNHDKDAGTMTVIDTPTKVKVLSAIQKGRGGPWIVRITNSPRLTFSQPA